MVEWSPHIFITWLLRGEKGQEMLSCAFSSSLFPLFRFGDISSGTPKCNQVLALKVPKTLITSSAFCLRRRTQLIPIIHNSFFKEGSNNDLKQQVTVVFCKYYSNSTFVGDYFQWRMNPLLVWVLSWDVLLIKNVYISPCLSLNILLGELLLWFIIKVVFQAVDELLLSSALLSDVVLTWFMFVCSSKDGARSSGRDPDRYNPERDPQGPWVSALWEEDPQGYQR